jgi:purine-binding chemotaxis protein CheW
MNTVTIETEENEAVESLPAKRDLASDILQLVSFRLGDEEYAVDILKVQEINRMVEITVIPNTPAYFEGVINLRGKVIPVVNLRKKFGLETKEPDSQTRIMVINVGTTIGLIVDSVSQVLRIKAETIEPPPGIAAGHGSEYIMGIGKLDDRLLIQLDLDKVLGNGELRGGPRLSSH